MIPERHYRGRVTQKNIKIVGVPKRLKRLLCSGTSIYFGLLSPDAALMHYCDIGAIAYICLISRSVRKISFISYMASPLTHYQSLQLS